MWCFTMGVARVNADKDSKALKAVPSAFLSAICAPHPVGTVLILAMSSISHSCSTS